jgi:excisionase family DNA binding protein
MITKTLQIQEISVNELTELITVSLLIKIEKYLDQLKKEETDVLLTLAEVAEYLRVSLVTISQWSKIGVLTPLRIGNRVLFSKKDILNILDESRP